MQLPLLLGININPSINFGKTAALQTQCLQGLLSFKERLEMADFLTYTLLDGLTFGDCTKYFS